jgi:uncharacterized protein YndB with AHSA1/START domain
MRAIVAVVVAFVAMSAFVFGLSVAPWFALGLDGVLEPGRFRTFLAVDLYAAAVGAIGAWLAGALCLRIGRARGAVVVLALLCFGGGSVNAVGQLKKSEPGARGPGVTVSDAIAARKEPAWFALLMPCLGVVGVLGGGRRRDRVDVATEYSTEVLIRAAPATVWRILTDSTGYAGWNPEVIAIDGPMVRDGRIKARVRLGDGAIRAVAMRVTAFEPPSRVQWTGGLPLGLFTGVRTFTVAAGDGGSRFRMHLRMSGRLAPMILASVGDRQPEIDRFSAALKARAEQSEGEERRPAAAAPR